MQPGFNPENAEFDHQTGQTKPLAPLSNSLILASGVTFTNNLNILSGSFVLNGMENSTREQKIQKIRVMRAASAASRAMPGSSVRRRILPDLPV